MKFIKTHLVSLICGLVVIVALAWLYFWVGSKQDDLHKNMQVRLDMVTTIAGYGKQAINIPGTQPFNGVITPDVIEAKNTVQEKMHTDADQIVDLASGYNETGRVVRRDEAGRIVRKKGTVIPLLDGNEEPHYLPVVANGTDPRDFYDHYTATLNRWLSLLVNGSSTPPPEFGINNYPGAVPPAREEVDKAWQDELHQQLIKSGGIAALQQGPSQLDFTRNYVFKQASKIRIYANRDSFQRRNSTDTPPEIFDALVDCWLQADVVHAINKVNTDAYKALPPEDQNVGHSPIKKLDHISVGFGQPGNANNGSLFSPGGHSGLDYSQSMTGRTGTAKYDVSTMQISMDLDPSYLNKFIDDLYQQNNSYTILNVKMTTVDPFVMSSYGYVYGKQQVVSVTLQVEVLLYRGWTDAIMPGAYKSLVAPAGKS